MISSRLSRTRTGPASVERNASKCVTWMKAASGNTPVSTIASQTASISAVSEERRGHLTSEEQNKDARTHLDVCRRRLMINGDPSKHKRPPQIFSMSIHIIYRRELFQGTCGTYTQAAKKEESREANATFFSRARVSFPLKTTPPQQSGERPLEGRDRLTTTLKSKRSTPQRPTTPPRRCLKENI